MIITIIILVYARAYYFIQIVKGHRRDDNKNIRWLVMIGFNGGETTTTVYGARIDGRTYDGVDMSVRVCV